MEYRESLEEQGIKNPEEIERKVAARRSRLQAEYGLVNSDAGASARSKYRNMLYDSHYLYLAVDSEIHSNSPIAEKPNFVEESFPCFNRQYSCYFIDARL